MGFFDGVHLGHQALIKTAGRCAVKHGLIPSIVSFDTPPKHTVTGGFIPLINTVDDRKDIVKRYFGIDDMIILHFDESLMRMSWESFLEWMINDFGACGFVAGYDFTFGYKGQGNAIKLAEKCAELKIPCEIVPRVSSDGASISSTQIRGLIMQGEMGQAVKLLGHPHILTATVLDGYKLGRKLGFPTINMRIPDGVICPRYGVYAAKVFIPDEGEFIAVTNVGVRPTVGGKDAVSVESYILDYNGDLYGRKLRVEFYEFIRAEMKFDSIDALKEQISRDADSTRKFFAE